MQTQQPHLPKRAALLSNKQWMQPTITILWWKLSLLCSFPNALCTELQVAHQSFIPAQRNPRVEQGSWGVLFRSNCAMFKIVTRPQRWVSCDLNTSSVVSLEKSSVNRCDIHDNIKATVWTKKTSLAQCVETNESFLLMWGCFPFNQKTENCNTILNSIFFMHLHIGFSWYSQSYHWTVPKKKEKKKKVLYTH